MDVPIITLEELSSEDPCAEEYAKIVAAFPDGIPLTKESATILAEIDAELGWAADNMLSFYAREKFDVAERPHREAYQGASDAAWQKYDEAWLQWSRHKSTSEPIGAAKERNAALEAARAVYNAAIVGLLLEAFLDDYNNNRGVFFTEGSDEPEG